MEVKEVEERNREYCPACGWIHYENPKISAGCRIEQDGKLLLVQRKNPPFAATWHFPSGYAEVDETPIQTAERETREESGLTVQAGKLVGAYFYNDDFRGNGVVLIYSARLIGGVLQPSLETTAVRFFTPAELAGLPLAGKSGTESVADWLSGVRHV
jgi:ADP-ribose pyrophosphatase YjhB (NUDIX family)